jgi:hypothetical protein
MSNFRTKLFGLAGIAMAFSGMAYGQYVCATVTPVAPILIRAEGTTEQLPSISITCTATPNAALAGNVNVQLFTSLPITSKVLNTTSGQTEAELQVGGAVPATGAYGTVSGTSVNWTVPVGAAAINGTVTFSVWNIRVNANGAVATTGAPTPVTEQLFITGPTTTLTASAPAAVTSAYVENGLAVAKNYTSTALTASGSNNFVTCTSSNLVTGQNLGLATVITVSDNFATAFKDITTGPVTGESPEQAIAAQTYNAVALVTNAVTTPTEFQLAFSNVPAGTTLYVPSTITAVNTQVFTLVSAATGGTAVTPTTPSTSNGLENSSGTTTFAPPAGDGGLAAVAVSGGAGIAVYQVTDPLIQTSITTVSVPVYLYAAANTITASSTALGVTVSFAPTGSTNIPNFTSTSSSTTLTSSVYSLCTTSLLFPFVTNQVGFDTGVSIANTSTDPFGSKLGAVPQSGTCTLNFYGNGAPTPSAVTGPNVPTGTSYTFQLSSVAPGFQGYLIAQCNFQFAHAFAFATNGASAGNAGTAFSYLAGVLQTGTANARVAGNGEGLGN